MTRADAVSFAVVGAAHPHVFELAEGLVGAGAVAAAHTPDGHLAHRYASWRPESTEATAERVIDDPAIDLVVLAGVPSERAELAVEALRHGKQVLSAKPGVVTMEQLDALRAELNSRPGRPWTVLFTERLQNRAVCAAIELAHSGALGDLVHVVGSGPHRLSAEHRPAWFWDPDASGGILVDLGSHQVDQFLTIAGGPGEVRTSSVGNVACRSHPAMQDIGSMTLVSNGIVGDHRVDLLTPDGLDVWGDVRLQIFGTAGTAEVRANIDAAGADGSEHLIVVDGDRSFRVDVSDRETRWAGRLLADLADGGERVMTQQHVLDVCDLSLRAQRAAIEWGST